MRLQVKFAITAIGRAAGLASRLDHAPALESRAAFQKENVAVSRDLPNAPLPPEPILPL
jgi:hypothetical protein